MPKSKPLTPDDPRHGRLSTYTQYRYRCRCDACKYASRLYYQERHYGGNELEYLEKQGGVCAACGSPDPRNKKGWHLDHCHDTKRIRAVLCAPCNVSLGMLGEDITRVRQLMTYIEDYC